MVFSSITFVMIFLPIIISLYISTYILIKKYNIVICNVILLIASLLFYAWGEPKYITLLIFSTLFNFIFGLLIATFYSKLFLIVGLIGNLLLLIIFKYLNFIADNGLLSLIFSPGVAIPRIALPLGISFFTFQGMSYLIDVYRKDIPPSTKVIDFGCYITMFPQLVAGPIVRYSSIAQELMYRDITIKSFASGASRFTIGLAKKILIADTCGRVADAAFSIPNEEVSFIAAWAGMVCYTIQIYFDFSGYSDMAIGLGKILGFTFPENFNYPYISKSIKEFWRRWHMTLSFWFRDYLYIPLGGSRKGQLRTYLNLLIVFSLCGLWHGAEWNFLIWGAYHGLFLILERIFSKIKYNIITPIKHIYTITVVMFGWVIFRCTNYTQIVDFAKGLLDMNPMTPINNKVFLELFSGDVYLAIILGIVLSTPIFKFLTNFLTRHFPQSETCLQSLGYVLILLLLLICYMPLFGSTYNAFIYFRF